MDPMSAGWEAFFFGAAFLAAACAALEIRAVTGTVDRFVNLTAVALALYLFVFAWNALAEA